MYYPHSFYGSLPLFLCIIAALSCIIPTLFMYYPCLFYALSPLFLSTIISLLGIIADVSCIIPQFYALFTLFMYYFRSLMYYCHSFMHYPSTFYVLSLLMDAYFPDPCFSLFNPCIFSCILFQCIYHSYVSP